MGRPKIYENGKVEKAQVFAKKKLSAGARQMSFYIEPEALEVLEMLKSANGLNNTSLLNLILQSAKNKPYLLFSLIGFDVNSIEKTIDFYNEKLEVARDLDALE